MTGRLTGKLKVNEIFYSLQGEGRFTGTAAVFIRLSGCNLACPFCDTDHRAAREMDAEEILEAISRYPARHAVITGGEPGLQLTEEFVDMLHDKGYFVQVETNGTVAVPQNIDWITCSPKTEETACGRIDELKLLFMGDGNDASKISRFDAVEARHRSLQPCDHSMETPDAAEAGRQNSRTLADCISYIKSHPAWHLSLQTHKLLNIP